MWPNENSGWKEIGLESQLNSLENNLLVLFPERVTRAPINSPIFPPVPRNQLPEEMLRLLHFRLSLRHVDKSHQVETNIQRGK